MNISQRLSLVVILLLGLMACEPDEGPAEKAGERIDEAVEETSQGIDEVAEETGENLEEAGDKLREETQ